MQLKKKLYKRFGLKALFFKIIRNDLCVVFAYKSNAYLFDGINCYCMVQNNNKLLKGID